MRTIEAQPTGRCAGRGGARGRAFFALQTAGKNTDPVTAQARRFFFCERQRTDLSSVSSAFFGLSSVRLRTEKPFHINKLEAFFRLSSVSSLFFAQEPKVQGVSSSFSPLREPAAGRFPGHHFPAMSTEQIMNRVAAMRYLKVHQPESPWSFAQPTKAQARTYLQGLAARGAPADVLSMQARMVALAMQGGNTLPPHLAAQLCHPRGASKV
jgi:hypothetical protein